MTPPEIFNKRTYILDILNWLSGPHICSGKQCQWFRKWLGTWSAWNQDTGNVTLLLIFPLVTNNIEIQKNIFFQITLLKISATHQPFEGLMWQQILNAKSCQILVTSFLLCLLWALWGRPWFRYNRGVISLRLSDDIWRRRSWSTMVQVMICCLMAPSHYLTSCWLMTSEVQWHSY